MVRFRAMSLRCAAMAAAALLAVAAQTQTTSAKLAVEASTDHGASWVSVSEVPSSSESTLVRLVNTAKPVIAIPPCALSPSLSIHAIRRAGEKAPFALRWANEACHGGTLPSKKSYSVTSNVPVDVASEWASFAGMHKFPDKNGKKTKETKKGLLSSYALWIMLFIGVALGRGIQTGLSELREEMEREEQNSLRPTAVEGRPANTVRVTVPRRRAGQNKKKNAASASSAGQRS